MLIRGQAVTSEICAGVGAGGTVHGQPEVPACGAGRLGGCIALCLTRVRRGRFGYRTTAEQDPLVTIGQRSNFIIRDLRGCLPRAPERLPNAPGNVGGTLVYENHVGKRHPSYFL